MAIKEVTATCRRLIALPKYENVLYECTATATVEDGEDPDKVYDQTLQFCKNKVGKELDRLSDVSAVQRETKRRIG